MGVGREPVGRGGLGASWRSGVASLSGVSIAWGSAMLREPQRKKEKTRMSVSVRVVGVWEAEGGQRAACTSCSALMQATRRPGSPHGGRAHPFRLRIPTLRHARTAACPFETAIAASSAPLHAFAAPTHSSPAPHICSNLRGSAPRGQEPEGGRQPEIQGLECCEVGDCSDKA